MRKLLLLLLVITGLSLPQKVTISTSADTAVIWSGSYPKTLWYSNWILEFTLYDGLKDVKPCKFHDWEKQDVKTPKDSHSKCTRLHDARGCPEDWALEQWICRKCYLWQQMREERVFLSTEFDRLRKIIVNLMKERK